MSRKCEISSKGYLNGCNVSHSKAHTRKISWANLHERRLFDSETKKWVRVRVSSRMLRTIDRKGLSSALRSYGMSIDDLK
jgi:large subunit ribosomal protein L28